MAACVAIALALAASFFYAPWAESGPVLCPLRLVTGLPCPGCGMTRAFCLIAHGRPGAAFLENPFAPPLFAGLIGAGALMLAEARLGRRVRVFDRFLFSMRAGYAVGALVALWHVGRLAHMALSGALWASVRQGLLWRACERLL